MNANVLLWLVLATSSVYTCFTGAVHRYREQDQNTDLFSRFNREKRDIGMTSRPSSLPSLRPGYTFRRWTTRPAGQKWTPFTGTINNNLTEKEISNRQNKTKWNFSMYPTANRFHSTLPYNRVTDSPVSQLNITDKLASNHHHNDSRTLQSTRDDRYWTQATSAGPNLPKNEKQSNKMSLEGRYSIVIAVMSAVLFLTLLGFVAHCNRARKRRKVLSITLA